MFAAGFRVVEFGSKRNVVTSWARLDCRVLGSAPALCSERRQSIASPRTTNLRTSPPSTPTIVRNRFTAALLSMAWADADNNKRVNREQLGAPTPCRYDDGSAAEQRCSRFKAPRDELTGRPARLTGRGRHTARRRAGRQWLLSGRARRCSGSYSETGNRSDSRVVSRDPRHHPACHVTARSCRSYTKVEADVA